MARKPIEPDAGLFRHGNRWWRWLRFPLSGNRQRVSLGTDDTLLANRVSRCLLELCESRPQWDLLALVEAGSLKPGLLYDHYAAGELSALRQRLTQAAADASDTDLDPLVMRWVTDHLPLTPAGPGQRMDYLRQVRALIPAGVPFPASRFNEETIKATLLGLKDKRSGELLSSSTRRRYVVAWQLFYRWAKKQAKGFPANPFEDADWLPANGAARGMHWEHQRRLDVLGFMTGEARALCALVLGSGMELGALEALQRLHVGSDRRVVAPGSKNEYRAERSIIVDAWAWAIFYPWFEAQPALPASKVLTIGEHRLREAFYTAQVRAGLVEKAPKSENYKPLWKRVHVHTLHDARHTYAINRLLGLDGEPRQSMKFVSHQLGHADEQMLIRIYNKTNAADRLRLIELAEAQQRREA